MALFQYKAVGADGEVVEGELQAVSRDHAVNQIHLKGQVPIRIEENRQKSRRSTSRSFQRKSVSIDQIASFTRELATLLKSGQPLDGALSILISIAGADSLFSQHLTSIRDSLKGG
ncbi:MAG: hypothetical protein B6D77_09480, partial [gamma proteobacterium symbiont of Ctena orbiculata]